MQAHTTSPTAEGQVRALIEKRIKAIRARDIDGCLSHSAPDIVPFDVVNPLRHVHSDGERRRLEE